MKGFWRTIFIFTYLRNGKTVAVRNVLSRLLPPFSSKFCTSILLHANTWKVAVQNYYFLTMQIILSTKYEVKITNMRYNIMDLQQATFLTMQIIRLVCCRCGSFARKLFHFDSPCKYNFSLWQSFANFIFYFDSL